MNPVAEALTGWNEADACGRPLMEVFHIVNEYTGEPCANPVEKVLSSGQVVGLANHTMLIARDGQERIIADSGAPITDTEGETMGVVLVFRDITDQQHLERELLKMEKLKSLGVLAGGIAHDFNNFLTGILGNLSMAKMDLQPGNPISRSLNEMEKAAVRAKDLTQQLLTFAKGGEPVKRTTDITRLVREATQFALHGSNVQCKLNMTETLMPVDVDEGQIAQVIHNLIINADQAMPNGGNVFIRGANLSLAKGNPYALSPGNYVQVAVQDQGIGIHPDYIKKVFDPYFTTKQKGSGLGLAVAYNIVAKHDGQLTVDSQMGEGTTFTILLPASTTSPKNERDERKEIVTGQGRILVMDDEDYIRELALSMLTKLGYEVVVAEDGQTAVDLYRKAFDRGRPYDAVILDLTVPGGMGGQETIARLIEIDKDVRAIVSSGYSNDPVIANYTQYGFHGAVQKPYLVQEMSQLLKLVLKT
jgi:PAS domain S-box-containing protein